MNDTGSYTARKNAKRAAEKMIANSKAPAVDYTIRPRDNGRLEIIWKATGAAPTTEEVEAELTSATGTVTANSGRADPTPNQGEIDAQPVDPGERWCRALLTRLVAWGGSAAGRATQPPPSEKPKGRSGVTEALAKDATVIAACSAANSHRSTAAAASSDSASTGDFASGMVEERDLSTRPARTLVEAVFMAGCTTVAICRQRHIPRMRAAISTRTPLFAPLAADSGSAPGQIVGSKSPSSSSGMKRLRDA